MPKTYSVCLPISGYVAVQVEAEDEESAIEAAMKEDVGALDIEEWQTHKKIVEGNFFYGSLARATAELIDDGAE